MKLTRLPLIVAASMALTAMPASAQNLGNLLGNLGNLSQAAQKLMQAAKVSDKELAQYAAASIAELDKQSKVSAANSAYTKRLNEMTKGITAINGIPLNFKVYETNEVNAFASPDGSVRVYSGLMDMMTDNELMGVIGHELGHLAHADSKKEYRHQLLTSAARDGLISSNGKLGKIAASKLGDIGESLIGAKYSRTQESAADDYGYDFLVSHKINPWAMAMAFEKMKAMEGEGPGYGQGKLVKNLMSSHPEMESRIKSMSERATKDGYDRAKVNDNKKTTTTAKKTTTKKTTTKKTTTTKKATTTKKTTTTKKK